MLFDTSNISIDTITNDCLVQKNIHLTVVRLDKVHPILSGNKLFKLHYFLEEAIQLSLPGLVTFGGPYSNHLVATAYACKIFHLKSIGFVRGKKPAELSATLKACISYGMQLHFLSRADYNKKESPEFLQTVAYNRANYLLVPEGGYSPTGAKGASLICTLIEKNTTHICTAIGTATTFAGLVTGCSKDQQVIGIPVLKGMNDISERVSFLSPAKQSFQLLDGYHFGGYAKKTPALLEFMNLLYQQNNIPTDFVYTAKMMFAVLDSIKKGFFAPGSKIACLHTGGLQGNTSLPAGTLIF